MLIVHLLINYVILTQNFQIAQYYVKYYVKLIFEYMKNSKIITKTEF